MSEDDQNDDFNIRETLEKYLSQWQWFALGAFLCLAMAYVYLRYATPQYQASTTILVKDDKKGGMLSELSAFSDMGLGNAMKSNIDNEIEILKSRTLIESTVKDLELNISIFEKGRVNTIEIYDNSIIDVHFVKQKKGFYNEQLYFEFVTLSADTFELIDKNEQPE